MNTKTSILLLILMAMLLSCDIKGTGNANNTYLIVPGGESNNAHLSSLTVSNGILSPQFNKQITSYSVTLPLAVDSLTVTPESEDGGSIVIINGSEIIDSGSQSTSIPLTDKSYIITIEVIAPDGITTKTYMVTVDKIYKFYDLYYGYIDGSCAATAQEYQTFDSTAPSGVYRLKQNYQDPYNVFCDMTTDGGCWMMVGFLGPNVSQSVMFSDYGTPVSDFSENTSTGLWSIDIHNNLLKGSEPLTEMAITLDNKFNSISEYEASDKVVYYQWGTYRINRNWATDQESGTFSYRLKTSESWSTDATWRNVGQVWDPRIPIDHYLSVMTVSSSGFYWGGGMNGNDTWNHYGYVWVR